MAECAPIRNGGRWNATSQLRAGRATSDRRRRAAVTCAQVPPDAKLAVGRGRFIRACALLTLVQRSLASAVIGVTALSRQGRWQGNTLNSWSGRAKRRTVQRVMRQPSKTSRMDGSLVIARATGRPAAIGALKFMRK